MSNKFVVGTVVLCDFELKGKKFLEESKESIIVGLKNYAYKIIKKVNTGYNRKKCGKKITEKVDCAFKNEKLQERVNKKFYPEIWKRRFVLIIYLNPEMKSAIVLPLTSKKPDKKEKKNTILLPKEKRPKILKGKESSWVIYDMPYYVNIKRLAKPKNRNNKPIDVYLDKEAYKEIILKYKEIIAEDIPSAI